MTVSMTKCGTRVGAVLVMQESDAVEVGVFWPLLG